MMAIPHPTPSKSSWHEDYLKWICSFANAQGGRIYIGKDDAGNIVGIEDHKKLMDEIPYKIKSNLGISVRVNLLQQDDRHFIEIVVPPYSVPVSLRGKYYYRGGSINQELTGSALKEFLLKRSGHTWDDALEPGASLDDIDEESVIIFLQKAKEADRLPGMEGLSLPQILEKLRLTKHGKLKRAAIVLFGKDPGAFYPNTFVKIGKFADNDFEIAFQEIAEGNMMRLLEGVLYQLGRKFLTKGDETAEYPVVVVREMLLNALIHRNYMGAPTQIRVYDDKLFVWNDGGLPESITLPQLREPHASHPRNPILAEVCFRGGYIDAWGSGTLKMMESCKMTGLPAPEMEEKEGGFIVTLFKDKFTEKESKKFGLNARQINAVQYVKERGKITNSEYQEINHISRRTATDELTELVDTFGFFKKLGTAGTSVMYELA